MKKSIKLLFYIFFIGIVLFLTGCRDTVLDNNIPTETEEVKETEEEEKVETTVLTKAKVKAINKELKKNHYLSFEEEVRSGVYDEKTDNVYTVRFYEVATNTDSKVTYVSQSEKILSSNLDGYSNTSYARAYVSDLKNNKYFSSTTVDEWKKDTQKTKVINWDLLKYKNDYDLYQYLLDGFQIKKKDEGYIAGEKEIYEKKVKATSDMLKNVDYDKLGDCIYTYILEDNKPVSAETKVTFTKGKTTYYCAVKINFNEISERKLTLKTLGVE